VAVERPQEDARAAARFGGELEPARLDARESFHRRDRRAHALAAHTLRDGPDVVRRASRVQDVKALERHPHRRDGGGIQFAERVAPDDGAGAACGDRRSRLREGEISCSRSRERKDRGAREQQREEARRAVLRLREDLVNGPVREPAVREQPVERGESRREHARSRERLLRQRGCEQTSVMAGNELHGRLARIGSCFRVPRAPRFARC